MTDKPVRDANGRWLPGSPGNSKGRPTRQQEDELAEVRQMAARILAEHFTPEVWAKIVDHQLEKAKKGDRFALKWLDQHATPPPTLVVISMATWTAIIDKQMKRALAGDLDAAKWLKDHNMDNCAENKE